VQLGGPTRQGRNHQPTEGGRKESHEAPGFGDSCSCGRFGYEGDDGEDQPRGHRWDGRRCSVLAVAVQKWLEGRC
jgi:hypothetical protein